MKLQWIVTPALIASAMGASVLASSTLGEGESEAPQALTANLSYVALKNWKAVLPSEQWTAIKDEVSIPHLDSEGFLADKAGVLKLAVDTNDDGKLDKEVKGSGGFLKLRSKGENGETFKYAIRLKSDGGDWSFSTGCAMSGKIAGTVVKLFDQNLNGRYDDFGKDAMLIGSGDGATLLSRVVNLDGDLYNLDVDEHGTQITCTPYEGATAQVDLSSEFDSRGELISAIISHESEEFHFNPARAKSSFAVPAGSYEFHSGYVEQGGESVMMRGGKMASINAKAGETRVVEWGGPLVAEFDFKQEDDMVIVQPDIQFFGRNGEEYHTFAPNAKSPKLIVMDKRTKKEVASGRFGGC